MSKQLSNTYWCVINKWGYDNVMTYENESEKIFVLQVQRYKCIYSFKVLGLATDYQKAKFNKSI